MIRALRVAGALAGLLLLAAPAPAAAANFSTGAQTAARFGVHEISLVGNGHVPNPFDTVAYVTFRTPSGEEIVVRAFYDGGDTWRARTYVSEAGSWAWWSSSEDPGLDGKHGSFVAAESPLRGKLRKHREDPKQWMTDDGRWFLNLSDTAYRLFNVHVPDEVFRAYVRDAVDLGFTSLRVDALGGCYWPREILYEGADASNWPWAGEDTSRFDLAKFQTTDARLRYLLDEYPDLYVQLILFGLVEWGTDGNGEAWDALPDEVKQRTMEYMIARWAAFPQIFWLLVNDMSHGPEFPRNMAFARDVGTFFAKHDPWQNLMSSGPTRDQTYPFTTEGELAWSTYIHIETGFDVSGAGARRYQAVPVHVFDGEDFYEQDWPGNEPRNPGYFYRRLFWSWLLSGGSSNYGGRFPYVHPYRQTGSLPAPIRGKTYTAPLVGADSLIHIKTFFERYGISLAGWRPADDRVQDLKTGASLATLYHRLFGGGSRRVKAMVRSDRRRLLVYHPNAAEGFKEEDNREAGPWIDLDHANRAGFRIDLRDVEGTFTVTWLRARDGAVAEGEPVRGGALRELRAPWVGEDVVAYFAMADGAPDR